MLCVLSEFQIYIYSLRSGQRLLNLAEAWFNAALQRLVLRREMRREEGG